MILLSLPYSHSLFYHFKSRLTQTKAIINETQGNDNAGYLGIDIIPMEYWAFYEMSFFERIYRLFYVQSFDTRKGVRFKITDH